MHDALDVGDLVDGFQQGKSLRMQDWWIRKEQRETERMIRRLKSIRWYRDASSDKTSSKYRLMRASQNRARRAYAKRNAAKEVARQKAWRHGKMRATVLKCRGPYCRATWCPIPGGKGRHQAYCSKQCARAGKTALERAARRRKSSAGRMPEQSARAETCPAGGGARHLSYGSETERRADQRAESATRTSPAARDADPRAACACIDEGAEDRQSEASSSLTSGGPRC